MSSLVYIDGILRQPNNFLAHSCIKCPYRTRSWSLLQNHIQRHGNTKFLALFDCSKNTVESFTCKECSFETHETVTWRNHIRNPRLSLNSGVLPSVKWFQCDKCSHKVKKKTHLKTHILYKHTPEEDISWFHCDRCLYKAKSKSNLRRHVNGKHPAEVNKDNRQFHLESTEIFPSSKGDILSNLVSETPQTYVSKLEVGSNANLLSHVVLKGVIWLKCDKCSYRTKNKYHLKSHIVNKHIPVDSIKWFQSDHCSYNTKEILHLKCQCDKCSAKFKDARSLNRHKKYSHPVSEKINWFYCSQCPYKTKWNETLKRHILNKHTPENTINWFQCDKCSYKCKQRSSLKKHELSMHTASEDINWFHCHECSYKCKWRRYLIQHILTQHAPDENRQYSNVASVSRF